jgi:hypothetical protein
MDLPGFVPVPPPRAARRLNSEDPVGTFRSIRLSLRFIVPLAITLALLAYGLVPLVDRLTLRWWVNDLDVRAHLVANTLGDQVAELVGGSRFLVCLPALVHRSRPGRIRASRGGVHVVLERRP